MPRARFRWDRDRQTLVAVAADDPMPPPGPMVLPDLAPYRSILTGEVIGGRRQHRDHLRAHGCVEIGNDRGGSPATRPYQPTGIAGDIRRAMGEG